MFFEELIFWVLIVAVLILISNYRDLRRKVSDLEARIDKLTTPTDADAAQLNSESDRSAKAGTDSKAPSQKSAWGIEEPPQTANPAPQLPIAAQVSVPKDSTRSASRFGWIGKVGWMVWLGGISISLAGVLLVRYSIEQELLGPQGRTILALLIGICLHAFAEWLTRRFGNSQAFAALAGGASITLYAALLKTLDHFPDTSTELIFALLALLSLATMFLALRQGPLLAAIGILGAYIVPILTGKGGPIDLALLYALLITTSALVLLRYVYRLWLFWGVLTGATLWWLLSWINSPDWMLSRNLYLFASLWAFLAIPTGKLLLTKRFETADKSWLDYIRDSRGLLSRTLPVVAIYTACYAIDLHHANLIATPLWLYLLVPLLWLYSTSRLPVLAPVPVLMLTTLVIVILSRYLHWSHNGLHIVRLQPGELSALMQFLGLAALLFTGYSSLSLKKGWPFTGFWAFVAGFTPPLLIALGYLLNTDFSVDTGWALATVLMGLTYLILASKLSENFNTASEQLRLISLSFVLSGHFALALAVAMSFREAGLTLALGLLLVPLAWVYQKSGYPLLTWVVRILLAILGLRLTANPWIFDYPADTHWTIWTYGGVTASCFLASWITRSTPSFQRWLQGAGSTLLILTINTEIRYWLYDGIAFQDRYTFTEAVINTLFWGTAGMIYLWRASLSQYLKALYSAFASLLIMLAFANHLVVVMFAKNPLWSSTDISQTPILNVLIPAYGLPILLLLVVTRFYAPISNHPTRQKLAYGLSGLALWFFVSMEIRHLWTPAMSLTIGAQNGEQYTYSAIWLLMATAGMLLGVKLLRAGLYRISLIFLALVTAKIFIVDMSALEGLLRVASFMGLGLTLLALGWLHQRSDFTRQDCGSSD